MTETETEKNDGMPQEHGTIRSVTAAPYATPTTPLHTTDRRTGGRVMLNTGQTNPTKQQNKRENPPPACTKAPTTPASPRPTTHTHTHKHTAKPKTKNKNTSQQTRTSQRDCPSPCSIPPIHSKAAPTSWTPLASLWNYFPNLKNAHIRTQTHTQTHTQQTETHTDKHGSHTNEGVSGVRGTAECAPPRTAVGAVTAASVRAIAVSARGDVRSSRTLPQTMAKTAPWHASGTANSAMHFTTYV